MKRQPLVPCGSPFLGGFCIRPLQIREVCMQCCTAVWLHVYRLHWYRCKPSVLIGHLSVADGHTHQEVSGWLRKPYPTKRLQEPPTSHTLNQYRVSVLFMTFQYFSLLCSILAHSRAQTFSTLVYIFSTFPLKSSHKSVRLEALNYCPALILSCMFSN